MLKLDDDYHKINSLGNELWEEDLDAEIHWGTLSDSTPIGKGKREGKEEEVVLKAIGPI